MTTQSPEAPKLPEVKKERVFVADNREFPDPDPNLAIGEVQRLLADFLPELHNAEVKETDKDGKHYVQFIKKVGTKG
jgi:PRTRC genetic system protein C